MPSVRCMSASPSGSSEPAWGPCFLSSRIAVEVAGRRTRDAMSNAEGDARQYRERRERLAADHHAQCMFRHNPPVDDLCFAFRSDGVLLSEFVCDDRHQGYERMVHGGLIAAVVDASMAQCLMGHGIVAYTTDLSLRYRSPVEVNRQVVVETRITEVAMGSMLYHLTSHVRQGPRMRVQAKGRFYRADSTTRDGRGTR
ncbi:MAG: hypothetical protein GF331_10545 [Chitinivibrionales bacterium]|nr:hypothetical protein [Chitinivibrionales bacterium]